MCKINKLILIISIAFLQCPGNVYLQDGSPCNDGEGMCNEGICLTRDLQCLNIWGTGPDGNGGLNYLLSLNLSCLIAVYWDM